MMKKITQNRWDNRILLGLLAGALSLLALNIRKIRFLFPMQEGYSAFNYSVILTMSFILIILNFGAGLIREYKISLTYASVMILYDALSTDLPTTFLAAVSLTSLLVGTIISWIASRLIRDPSYE
ncbi:MAG: hypothetical protein NWE89_04025 [Candidatus Bathyarchaeota archaeon]|nr:hypothetical protein [Candidatus Bathyarchaeota archaeon]